MIVIRSAKSGLSANNLRSSCRASFFALSIGLSSFPERFVPLPYEYYYKLFGLSCQPFILTFSDIFENFHLTFSPFRFTLYAGGDNVTARQIIEMAVAYCGINNSELARRLEWSPQLLNKRLNTGKFTVDEWQRIANALGATAKIGFSFPDGGSVGL